MDRSMPRWRMASTAWTTLTLKTNLRGEETTYNRLFGVVDEASMVRRHNRRDRPSALLGCEIVLSAWIREALEARRVLTLHSDYFPAADPAGQGRLSGGAQALRRAAGMVHRPPQAPGQGRIR